MKIFSGSNGQKLTTNEKYLIDLIEKKPETFASVSITQFAKQAFVSIGAITKLVHKLGFSNLREMKNFVIKENYRNKNYYKLTSKQNIEGSLNDVVAYNRHAIEKTIDILNLENIKNIAELISNSKKLITYGIGSSMFAANEFASNLSILGLDAISAPSIHSVILWMRNYHEEEAMVIIYSKNLWSAENEYLVQLLQKHQVRMIIITSNKAIKKEDKKEVIYFETLDNNNQFPAFFSKISQIFISDVLTDYLHKIINNRKNSNLYDDFIASWQLKQLK